MAPLPSMMANFYGKGWTERIQRRILF